VSVYPERAKLIAFKRESSLKGLSKQSTAPSAITLETASSSTWAVMKMIGILGR
jgi:hypothetical protein